ncbi:HEPN domain-containing protein [Paenibacillus sedimenti]|uniref:Apea-like HEPN domain-containing protein n=1 Tax=Paenibacillus sedimenti TaxID=2770274 RepID=A0A926KQH9_9BACL|nr:HEPN domain-containing protein [Paenibacillus sedimenti]MBD0381301.1 hypothetical protein [Paenibacillus sedimenti]
MNFTIVSSIYKLKLQYQKAKGKRIFDNYRLSNSSDVLLSEIVNPNFYETFGKIKVDVLFQKPYLYAHKNIPGIELTFENAFDSASSIAHDALENIKLFTLGLWLIKDNSVDIAEVDIYCYDGDFKYSINRHDMRVVTDASGIQEDVEFSDDEIEQAINYADKIKSFKGVDFNDTNYNEIHYNELSRFDRALGFIKHARAETLLPLKIAFYVQFLESIITASKSTELTHRIGERLARLLGKDFEERKEIYSQIKRAYAVRSSFVHGQQLDRSYRTKEVVLDISLKLDNYIRQVMIIMLTEHAEKLSLKDEEYENWFQEIVLS